jgi:hypothetical protein
VIATETFLYEGETILVDYRSIGLGFLAAFSLGVSERCISGLAIALRDKLQKGTLFYQVESYSHLYDDAATL